MSTGTGSNACPTFFRALCHEAENGGEGGFATAAYQVAPKLAELLRDDLGDDEIGYHLELLDDAIRDGRPLGALAWFEENLPRCFALVPPSHYRAFAEGLFRYVIEDGNDITDF